MLYGDIVNDSLVLSKAFRGLEWIERLLFIDHHQLAVGFHSVGVAATCCKIVISPSHC